MKVCEQLSTTLIKLTTELLFLGHQASPLFTDVPGQEVNLERAMNNFGAVRLNHNCGEVTKAASS